MTADGRSDSALNFNHFQRFKGNATGVRSLVQSFLNTAPDLLLELENSLKRQDHERARNLLHALTGSALSTGAVALAERCAQWSRAWEEMEPPATLPFERLREEFEKARAALREFLETLPASEARAEPASDPRRPTVLLVEDNPPARALVRLALEDRFTLLEAANGQEALALVEREPPDLAIVDLHLGRPSAESPSGFTLLRQFQRRVPAIVLTVDQRPESLQRAIEAGAWGYLLKSHDLTHLPAMIEVVLARSRETWEHAPGNLLDLATGCLMASYHLDQDAARQALIGFATEQRRRTLEVAQDILAAHHFERCIGHFITNHLTGGARASP